MGRLGMSNHTAAKEVPFQSHPKQELASCCGSWGGGAPGAPIGC